MKFILDRNFSENYQSVVVDIHCEGKWVSRRYILADDDVDTFIQSYLDGCKIEMVSAFGVNEWWVVDSDSVPMVVGFSNIGDAKEYLENLQNRTNVVIIEQESY